MIGRRRRATAAIAALARSRRALVWAGVLAAQAVGMCFVPLFDVLGRRFTVGVRFRM